MRRVRSLQNIILICRCVIELIIFFLLFPAKSLFIEFGNMLQRRRLHDDYRICTEYLNDDDADDPYYYDPELADKLDYNRKHRKKEQTVSFFHLNLYFQVFNYYFNCEIVCLVFIG